jgi:hypothetical protein
LRSYELLAGEFGLGEAAMESQISVVN